MRAPAPAATPASQAPLPSQADVVHVDALVEFQGFNGDPAGLKVADRTLHTEAVVVPARQAELGPQVCLCASLPPSFQL